MVSLAAMLGWMTIFDYTVLRCEFEIFGAVCYVRQPDL